MAEKWGMNTLTFGRIRVVGECPTNQYKSIPLFGVMVQVKSQTCEWSPFVMTILGLLWMVFVNSHGSLLKSGTFGYILHFFSVDFIHGTI